MSLDALDFVERLLKLLLLTKMSANTNECGELFIVFWCRAPQRSIFARTPRDFGFELLDLFYWNHNHVCRSYLPVVHLCRILGLRAETRIPRWRKLLLWRTDRKLPVQTETHGRRIVWCLPFGTLPFWFCSFNWNDICSERLYQLAQVSQLLTLPERIHQEMLAHYRQLRCFLFWFLMTYKDADAELLLLVEHLSYRLDSDEQKWFNELTREGRVLINEATTLARKILHEQETIPIVDACVRDHYGTVAETFSCPVLPLISAEDEEALFESIEMLQEWLQDLRVFVEGHSSPSNE